VFRWWIDDDMLGSSKAIVTEHDRTDNPEIPIAVARMMWKACFFDKQNDDLEMTQAEYILDSIQRTLENDLCYLEKIDMPSCSCFRLSLGAYTEYGWYILRQDELEEQISSWHNKLSLSLRQVLLHSKARDADGELYLL
jgi:hypothetical protein